MIRAILLDVDGTLLKSNDAHAQSWVDAFQKFGYHKSFQEVRNCIGMGGDNLLPTLIGIEKDSPQGKELSSYRDQVFRSQYLSSLKPCPGSRDLVKRLRDLKLKLTVASSSNKKDLDALLDKAGVLDLIETKVSGDHVEKSKPEPDIVQRALQESGVEPSQAIMLGDTPYDIEAAQRAKVGTIALRSGGWSDEQLKNAIAIYDDPKDLLIHLEETPLCSK